MDWQFPISRHLYITPNPWFTSGDSIATLRRLGFRQRRFHAPGARPDLAGRKLMGHTELVSQDISLDARQERQHYVVGGVVI